MVKWAWMFSLFKLTICYRNGWSIPSSPLTQFILYWFEGNHFKKFRNSILVDLVKLVILIMTLKKIAKNMGIYSMLKTPSLKPGLKPKKGWKPFKRTSIGKWETPPKWIIMIRLLFYVFHMERSLNSFPRLWAGIRRIGWVRSIVLLLQWK